LSKPAPPISHHGQPVFNPLSRTILQGKWDDPFAGFRQRISNYLFDTNTSSLKNYYAACTKKSQDSAKKGILAL
jgi:hypothetical protein